MRTVEAVVPSLALQCTDWLASAIQLGMLGLVLWHHCNAEQCGSENHGHDYVFDRLFLPPH